MRILVALKAPPWPPNYGGALRELAVIRALAQAGHQVTLTCPLAGERRPAVEIALSAWVSRFLWVPEECRHSLRYPQQAGLIATLARYLADVVAHPATPLSFRRPDNRWAALVAGHTGSVDAAYCRPASLAPVLASLGYDRVLVDGDDLDHLFHWRSARAGKDGHRAALMDLIEGCRAWVAEQQLARHCATLLVSSEEDARHIFSHRVTLIPNGVDFEAPPAGSAPASRTILFVGHCGWGPNWHGLKWFIEDVWPKVTGRYPDARLQIVGRSASPESLPFAVQPGIHLMADVPSVAPWYSNAAVVVVPLLFAAGTRIKILEALGYGVPVVSTRIGAAGLTERFSEASGLFLHDHPAAMAERISEILGDPSGPRAAAAGGAARVREDFAWAMVTRRLTDQLAQWVPPRAEGLTP